MKRILSIFSPFFHSALVVLVASLFVMSVVYAATTIGSNISTGGNLDVDGTASTTNATTTGYLYVGGDVTEPPGWNFGVGDLIVEDDVFFNSQATTSASLWVGSAGTANNINMAGGDLFVQDSAEIDGNLFISGRATTTSATSTAYVWVGGSFALPASFNYTDDLAVNGDAIFNGKATTTSLWVGPLASGAATSTTGASGDLFVDNSLEVKNKLFVGGGLFSLSSGTPTSTKGLFVGATGNTGTTTVGIGTVATGGVNGCIELTMAGLYYACYINPATPPTIVCSVNRCNP